ncbi:hypothetical protein GN956_G22626 [Arapaima gigas]
MCPPCSAPVVTRGDLATFAFALRAALTRTARRCVAVLRAKLHGVLEHSAQAKSSAEPPVYGENRTPPPSEQLQLCAPLLPAAPITCQNTGGRAVSSGHVAQQPPRPLSSLPASGLPTLERCKTKVKAETARRGKPVKL